MNLVELFTKHVEEPDAKKVGQILKKYNDSVYGIEDDVQSFIIGSYKWWDKAPILLACIAVNELFSTGIMKIGDMARHISDNADKIHELILKGDAKAVGKIAEGHGIQTKTEGREYNFYSFATKYCSFVNPEKYPIYDTYVVAMLRAYNDNTKWHFADFKVQDLKDYSKFRETVEAFIAKFGLGEFSFRDVDKFLWYYGKEIVLKYKNETEQKQTADV